MEPQVGHEENCLFPDLYMNHRKKTVRRNSWHISTKKAKNTGPWKSMNGYTCQCNNL